MHFYISVLFFINTSCQRAQKIILYLISKIKPDEEDFTEYEFSIKEFCSIAGINKSGKNYNELKNTIKKLNNKSSWLSLENGDEFAFRWIEQPFISKNSGIIKIELNKYLKPYLLELKKNFTNFSLIYILAMKSKYSIRLYEILKSYQYKKIIQFNIIELKQMLHIEQNKYKQYGEFKKRVLEKACSEINVITDINIDYEVFKTGREYTHIKFKVHIKKEMTDRLKAFGEIHTRLNQRST